MTVNLVENLIQLLRSAVMVCLVCIEECERQRSHNRTTDLDLVELIELEYGLVVIQASHDAVIAKVHDAIRDFFHDVDDVPHVRTILDFVDGIAHFVNEIVVVAGSILAVRE